MTTTFSNEAYKQAIMRTARPVLDIEQVALRIINVNPNAPQKASLDCNNPHDVDDLLLALEAHAFINEAKEYVVPAKWICAIARRVISLAPASTPVAQQEFAPVGIDSEGGSLD